MDKEQTITLPKPRFNSDTSLEQAFYNRHSVRSFTDEPLTVEQVSQLLWAAQGVNKKRERGFRTAPSAGACYPLEVYAIVKKVQGVREGIYHYNPEEHSLSPLSEGTINTEIEEAVGQPSFRDCPFAILITAFFERTMKKYEDRGLRYIHMDVGLAAENVYLQVTTLNLGTVFIGSFEDEKLKSALHLPSGEHPLCLMPVGHRQSK